MSELECSVCVRPFWSMEERAICPACQYLQKPFIVVYEDKDGWHADKFENGAWYAIGLFRTQKEAYEATKAVC